MSYGGADYSLAMFYFFICESEHNGISFPRRGCQGFAKLTKGFNLIER